jgi:hypothetical protein
MVGCSKDELRAWDRKSLLEEPVHQCGTRIPGDHAVEVEKVRAATEIRDDMFIPDLVVQSSGFLGFESP